MWISHLDPHGTMCLDFFRPFNVYLTPILFLFSLYFRQINLLYAPLLFTTSFLWVFENAFPSSTGLCTAGSSSFSLIQFKFISSESPIPSHPILMPSGHCLTSHSDYFVYTICHTMWLSPLFITLPILSFSHLSPLDSALPKAESNTYTWYNLIFNQFQSTIYWEWMTKQMNKLVK